MFVAGLRLSGIVAPFLFDGPVNRDALQAYVERILVPELAPGDIVVMDNLPSHKGPALQAAIEGAGVRLLYLPSGLASEKWRALSVKEEVSDRRTQEVIYP